MTMLATKGTGGGDAKSAPKPERESTSLRHLWRFLRFSLPYWPSLLAGFVTGLARMGLGLVMPWFLKYVIDDVGTPFVDGQLSADAVWSRIGWIALAFAAAMVIHWGVTLGRFYYPFVAAASAIRDIRFRLFQHLQRLSLGFHTQRPTGSLVARVIADVEAAQQAFDLILIQLSQMILRAIVITVILFSLDWQWALVAFATTPIFLVTTRLVRRPMRRATRRTRESVERISGLVQERFSMVREVQAFTAERHEERQVLGEAETLRLHTLRQRLLAGFVTAATEITRLTGLIIVLVFGLYRITHGGGGEVTLGMLPLYYMYTAQLLQPLEFFANLYTQMQVSAAAADRVYDFFDTTPDIQDAPGAKPLALSGAPRVTFDHVSFSYPADTPVVVLRDVSFAIAPGSKVVLVGESGAGKSTLMSLLPRFYDIQGGRILLDDTDLRDVRIRSLRKAIAIVPQEPVLFSGTIGENIQYGRREATMDEIRSAARSANAERFILETEHGYDTLIGERGVGLSGGQIQRIAIARAFLKNPGVLIMDEPTSNLDATSEALVMEALARLAAGRTTFVIAHRLSVARDADCIIALDAGRVAEMGTHDELIERGGLYAQLWARQVGAGL